MTEVPEYRPLAFCPRSSRKRYSLTAERASRGAYRDAVKLKCLDCCGWEYPEAQRCQIPTCALWSHNQRIFRARGSGG
jgi:hypothetical protein